MDFLVSPQSDEWRNAMGRAKHDGMGRTTIPSRGFGEGVEVFDKHSLRFQNKPLVIDDPRSCFFEEKD